MALPWDSNTRLPPWKIDVANTDAIAQTIRTRESGGKYDIGPNSGGASGAYQFIDPTWRSLTKKYNIGTQYTSAYMAPANVQDAVAKHYISDILVANDGDIVSIPYTWYVGNPSGTWSDSSGNHTPNEVPAGNKVSVNDYAKGWLADYVKTSGQSPGEGTLAGIISVVTNPGDTAGNIAEGATQGFDSILGFAQTIWRALTNRDNWIRVGMVVGALLLAIFGMMTISKSFGGPSITDTAKLAAKGAALA